MKAEDEVTWFDNALEAMTTADLAYSNRAGKAVLKNACREYHQSKLQALKEEVVKEVIWAEENQVGEDEEKYIEWNRGYRNAMKTALNLITKAEDNG